MKEIKHLIILFIVGSILTSCGASKYAMNTSYPTVNPGLKYDGILEECIHDCSVDGPEQRRMFVYLPSDYYESQRRYPVFYLLHGARGNELSWITKGNLLHNIDSLISSSKMKETIVVLPNVNQYKDERDFGKSRLKGAIESFFETDGIVEAAFMKDVVATIDRTYRTIPNKEHRAIAGLSIGAMQSMYISANAPESFGYVGLFSSMVHPVLRKSEYSSYSKYLKKMGYPFEMYITSGGHQWYNWEEFANIFMQKLWKVPRDSHQEALNLKLNL